MQFSKMRRSEENFKIFFGIDQTGNIKLGRNQQSTGLYLFNIRHSALYL